MRPFNIVFRAARPASLSTFLILCATNARGTPSVGEEANESLTALDRASTIRIALARSPSLEAGAHRARAIKEAARAEGRLPPPQAMVWAWQIPISRPYAVNDAGMVMVGVQQEFPAPGAASFRRDAKTNEAAVEQAMTSDKARQIARDADHAFSDYVEATARHRIHVAHFDIARRLYTVTQARHGAGGSLADATQAEAELARVQADVVTDAARVQTARARINALLVRPPSSNLAPPVEAEPTVPASTVDEILKSAYQNRPELRVASADRAAKDAELAARHREATWPSFNVAALYFAPTGPSPTHGYGVNAGMSLPWVWGPFDARQSAQKELVASADKDIEAARITIQAEVVTSDANGRSAALRLQILRDKVLPATKRALDVALSGYESSRTELTAVLNARKAVIETEMDLLMSRSSLDHALADLDAAVGKTVPRAPLGPYQEPGGR